MPELELVPLQLGIGGIFALLVIREVRTWREKELAKKNGTYPNVPGDSPHCGLARDRYDKIQESIARLATIGTSYGPRHETLAVTMSKIETALAEIKEHTRDTKNSLLRMEQNSKKGQ
jgi:hypothetical protein